MGGAGVRPSRRDALLLAALFLGTLGLAAAGMAGGDLLHDRFPGLSPEAFYHLVPFAAGAMLARSLVSAEVAPSAFRRTCVRPATCRPPSC